MAAAKTTIDVDGSDVMSSVIMDLLNTCPTLGSQVVAFSTLAPSSGLAFFPSSGAAIQSDKEDILGHVTQICVYPFMLVYRAAPKTEAQRLKIKEFLDTVGKWMELQPVTINGMEYKLSAYPDLSAEGREIKSIRRTNPGHLNASYTDGIEDWVLEASLKYENNFDK